MSPNAGGDVAGSQPMSTAACAHGAQINFGDLGVRTPDTEESRCSTAPKKLPEIPTQRLF